MGNFTRVKVLLAAGASLTLVVYLGCATSEDFHLYLFYFIPVALCAWNLGLIEVALMAVLGAAGWSFAEVNAGRVGLGWGQWFWNAFISLMSLLVLGLIIHRHRRHLREQKRRHEELQKTVAELQQANHEIRKLQGKLQVVCAWTKRIKVEGKWITYEEFLKRHLNINLSHGMSPEACEKFSQEITGHLPEAPPPA
jgi:uncharacterized membrane protein